MESMFSGRQRRQWLPVLPGVPHILVVFMKGEEEGVITQTGRDEKSGRLRLSTADLLRHRKNGSTQSWYYLGMPAGVRKQSKPSGCVQQRV